MNDVEKVCTPVYLDGLRYFLTSMTARHHENEAADEKTFDLVCSQKVSLLSTSRGAKLD